MLKRKKVFIILLIIIFIFGIILILNNTKKVAKTEHNGRIGVIYNSNATQVENNIEQQMTLSTEKTTGAMENNSKVLQRQLMMFRMLVVELLDYQQEHITLRQ